MFSVCWTVFGSCCLAPWVSGLGNSWMPQEITYRLGGNFWPSRASAKLHGDPLAARGRWLYPTVGLVNLNNYHQKTLGGFLKWGIPQNYFTSCDPHHDIYPFCYWQIFWHSIWHISDKIIEKTNLNICWKLEMEILKTFEFSNARVSFLQRLCGGTCAEHLELSTEQGACAAASATQWQLATHLVAPGSLKLGNMACLANEFASTF